MRRVNRSTNLRLRHSCCFVLFRAVSCCFVVKILLPCLLILSWTWPPASSGHIAPGFSPGFGCEGNNAVSERPSELTAPPRRPVRSEPPSHASLFRLRIRGLPSRKRLGYSEKQSSAANERLSISFARPRVFLVGWRSLLARGDTLCNAGMTNAERRWLTTNRSSEAMHWRILASLSPELVRYAR